MATSTPGLTRVGEFWHYELRVNGQRLHGSTKAKDLATAKKILEVKRREALEGQYKIIGKIPMLKELYNTWEQRHRSVHSAKHLCTVECIYRRWLLPPLGAKPLDQIRNQEALSLRAEVLNAGRSARYANNVLQTLKLILCFGIKLQYLAAMPYSIRPLRIQVKPRPTVPTMRVRDFLIVADRIAENSQVATMLWTLLGLGVREGELLGMRWEWFDPERQTYTVGKAKGKEARVLPLPEWLWAKLWVFPQESLEWVFPATDGKPHRSGYLRKPLDRLCRKLMLPRISQHRLRATFASLHAESGTPISEIQGMLGHKNIQTTMIYVEQSLEAKREAQKRLGNILGLDSKGLS